VRHVLLYKKQTACHIDYRALNRYGRGYLFFAHENNGLIGRWRLSCCLTLRLPRGQGSNWPPRYFAYNFFHRIFNWSLLDICWAIIFTHFGVNIMKISQSNTNIFEVIPNVPRVDPVDVELTNESRVPDFISSKFQWLPIYFRGRWTRWTQSPSCQGCWK